MKARAPGKVVISGAYAVLEGAPCIVTAVDRYVLADSERTAEHVADETRAAMPPPFPHVDASELRDEGRKLGLGSSAAIVVASLASTGQFNLGDERSLAELYRRALFAHRAAQGGGSGADVAAATFGGTLVFRYDAAGPGTIEAGRIPSVHLEVWSCPQAAVTRGFLRQVRELKQADVVAYARIFDALSVAAERAVEACELGSPEQWLAALAEQNRGLAELGKHAEIPIVTSEVADLHALAKEERAIVMPAGAGGGDLALFCALQPPSDDLLAAARERQVRRLDLCFGARGVHIHP